MRTKRKTNYEKKLKKKVQTSGCAQGTVFGDLMEALENVSLPEGRIATSWLYALTHKINTTPSLYLEAGAIHGCVLAQRGPAAGLYGRRRPPQRGRQDRRLDVPGSITPADKIFYTTGRLTSEMVIKTVSMGIPILISRSGFTAWGVELARKANLTLIGRARGKRFVALAGERIVFDQDLAFVEEESAKHRRKAAVHDDELPADFGPALAGGLARRMGGGDKARIEISGVSILDRVLATLSAQCTGMIINANGDPKRFADTGLTVVADSVPDFAGPLAGILPGWIGSPSRRTVSSGSQRAGRLPVPAG